MQVVKSPVAFVRLVVGGTVQLEQGAEVPAEGLDADHVDRLTATGVIGDPDPEPEPEPEPTELARSNRGRGRSNNQGS